LLSGAARRRVFLPSSAAALPATRRAYGLLDETLMGLHHALENILLFLRLDGCEVQHGFHLDLRTFLLLLQPGLLGKHRRLLVGELLKVAV